MEQLFAKSVEHKEAERNKLLLVPVLVHLLVSPKNMITKGIISAKEQVEQLFLIEI